MTMLTEAQEEAIVLIGHGAGDDVEPCLRGARGELAEAGLVAFTAAEGWSLTAAGQLEHDWLCRD